MFIFLSSILLMLKFWLNIDWSNVWNMIFFSFFMRNKFFIDAIFDFYSQYSFHCRFQKHSFTWKSSTFIFFFLFLTSIFLLINIILFESQYDYNIELMFYRHQRCKKHNRKFCIVFFFTKFANQFLNFFRLSFRRVKNYNQFLHQFWKYLIYQYNDYAISTNNLWIFV